MPNIVKFSRTLSTLLAERPHMRQIQQTTAELRRFIQPFYRTKIPKRCVLWLSIFAWVRGFPQDAFKVITYSTNLNLPNLPWNIFDQYTHVGLSTPGGMKLASVSDWYPTILNGRTGIKEVVFREDVKKRMREKHVNSAAPKRNWFRIYCTSAILTAKSSFIKYCALHYFVIELFFMNENDDPSFQTDEKEK